MFEDVFSLATERFVYNSGRACKRFFIICFDKVQFLRDKYCAATQRQLSTSSQYAHVMEPNTIYDTTRSAYRISSYNHSHAFLPRHLYILNVAHAYFVLLYTHARARARTRTER